MLQSIVAAAFLLLGVAYGIGSLLLPLGTLERPGPGLFPLIVTLIMTSLSGLLLRRSLYTKEAGTRKKSPFPKGADLQRVLALGSALILFAVLVQPLGFGVASVLLMAAVLRLLGMSHWGWIAFSAVLTTAVTYWLFALLLDVPLPPGELF